MKKTFIFDGVKYIMGIGGLHSSDPGDLFESTEDLKIIDADVGSYYPTMIINNNIHPEHLGGSFIKKYKEIRDSRLEAKKKGDKTTSEAFKIILNSSYGKMKSDKHWLYDPLCALQVTINCQLYLIMLIEKLVLNGFKVISANTDGIVTMVPTKDEDKYKELCKEWEEYTNFSLEYSIYKKYARRDVNNYIAIKDNGDVKTKGDFTIPDINKLYQDPLMLRRGFNKPIISIALNEYFINDTPIEETIKNHKDIYNFCTSQKTDKSFRNEYHFVENREAKINNLQQSVRYYVSKDGGSLYKRHKEDGRLINYCVGKNVTLFNDYFDSENYNIDYNYYINQTQKIIDEIINPQLTLF